MSERNIQIRLLPKQIEAMTALNDPKVIELLYGGSAGSGKSDFGCTWIIVNCLAYPGSRWLIGRSKLSQLKQTTMKTFKDVAKRYGLEHNKDWKWTYHSNEVHFANGSEIILKDLYAYPSDPDFDSLGSLEITGAFIDEASQITERAYSTVKSRIRYKLDEFKLTGNILMTCNPSKNFLYPNFYIPSKEGKLDPSKRFIKALPTDNPFLPESYLEKLRKLDPTSYQRLYLGQWEYDDDPSAMIPYDKILELFNNSHIFVSYVDTQRTTGVHSIMKDGTKLSEHYMTVDPAYQGGDSTVILVWHGLKVVKYYEYHGETVSNAQTIEKVKEFQTKYHILNKNITIDVGGGYGNAIWEAFKDSVRFNGNSASQSKEHKNLRVECFYKLAELIKSNEIWFPVDDTETQLRITRELEQLKRDKIDSDSKLDTVSKSTMKEGLHGRSPDYLDAMAMRMLQFLVKKETPTFSFYVIGDE